MYNSEIYVWSIIKIRARIIGSILWLPVCVFYQLMYIQNRKNVFSDLRFYESIIKTQPNTISNKQNWNDSTIAFENKYL